MDDVFTKMPDWLEYLKSTNIIFEEPEVSGIRDDHEIHLDLTGDDEAAAAEGTAAEDAPRAPAHWIKTHPVRNGETLGEQLKQVEELSSRALWRGVGTFKQHVQAGVGTKCSNSRFKRC